MNGRRWLFGAAAVAGVIALVAPAVGQGKAGSAALEWSRSRGGPTITSYDFGDVDAGSSGSIGFRLGGTSPTKSGKLAISLTGSPAFSIAFDKCRRKSIGVSLSCWVGVGYAPPPGAPTGDSATLRATGEGGATATLSLSGSSSVRPASGHVYWVNYSDGTVNSVPRGGGSVTTLASGQDHPISLAVDDTHVYWVNLGDGTNGTVNEVPLGGGAVTTLAGGQAYPRAVAVDATHVYWVNGAPINGYTSNGTVNEVPLGGGAVTTLASGQNTPVSVAVDGTHVYWINYAYGTINEIPLGGGSVTALATGAWSMAVDDTHVYWVDYSGSAVKEAPLGGGPVTTLASGRPTVQYPVSVAVDGTHVYWLNPPLNDRIGPSAAGSVYEVPLAGGSATKLAGNLAPFRGLAVDATHLYWLGTSDVEKMRLGSNRVATLAGDQNFSYALALGP